MPHEIKNRSNGAQNAERVVPSVLSDYLTEDELATQVGRSRRTLRLWRQRRIGPTWTQLGREILYPVEGVRNWLRSLERQPVREREVA